MSRPPAETPSEAKSTRRRPTIASLSRLVRLARRSVARRIPGGRPLRKGPFVGYFEGLHGTVATGWVFDPDRPDEPATVEFLVGGKVIHRATANQYRDDVAAEGHGGGRAGFYADLPLDLSAGPVEVHARLAGTSWRLNDSPRTATLFVALKKWLGRRERVTGRFRDWLGRRLTRATEGLTLSIVVPVYNTRPDWLAECLESVLGQWCGNWELICVDDASTNPETRRVLEDFSRRDPRVTVLVNAENRGIARSTNAGIAAAKGTHVAFLDHDDALEPDAVFQLLHAARSGAELVYCDEILTGENISQVMTPQIRPAYSWDCYLSHPYFVHMVCVEIGTARAVGGWDETMRISGDVDFVLRVSERATKVAHVPAILYRWRTHGESAGHQLKDRVVEATTGALNRHLARVHPGATAKGAVLFNHFQAAFPDPGGPVLVVIPTKNRVDLLSRCVDSILATTQPGDVEILVVDHQSDDPETLAWLAENRGRIEVFRFEGPFNYARINNAAVAHARATRGALPPFLLFANNDIEAIEPGWLSRMRSLAARDDVGAVGATLLYPDDTIQHAGVVIGLNGPADHAHKFVPFWRRKNERNRGLTGMLLVTRDYSAVTAACLMTRSSVFEAVGGFDEGFAVGFNDTDLCLRIGRTGLKILNDAHTVLYHHESATRRASGGVSHPEDAELFHARWDAAFAEGDRFYSPLFTASGHDHHPARYAVDFPRARVREGLGAGKASPFAQK